MTTPSGLARTRVLASTVVLVGVALGAVLLSTVLFPGRHIHEPVHSTLETAGAMIAFVIASVLVWGRSLYNDPALDVIATGLVLQGVLDLVHSVIHTGPPFFWSRTLPTLLGGLVFAAVWVPRDRVRIRVMIGGALAASLAIGILLLAVPPMWPNPFDPRGGYLWWSKLLNMLGGGGFLAAAVFFFRRVVAKSGLADEVFGHHCLLFAVAGFAFGLSSRWDGAWWAFHVLRLAAYVVSLLFLVDLLRRLAARRAVHSATEMEEQLAEIAEIRAKLLGDTT